MWTDDPVRDADDYYNALDIKAEMIRQRLPKCEICGKPIEDELCIDLSEGYCECMVHKNCLHDKLTGKTCELSEDIREQIWTVIDHHCLDFVPEVDLED